MRTRWLMMATLALVLVLAVVPGALAFEEEQQSDGNDCMGPTDPFCPNPPHSGGGGGSGGSGAACERCELGFTDPLNMGGTARYMCVSVDPLVENGYWICQDGDDTHYCPLLESPCQVA